MLNRLFNVVVWVTLAQVVLVGAVGTGLHSLFGCEHGPIGCRDRDQCDQACCTTGCGETAGGHACAFCDHQSCATDVDAEHASDSITASIDGVACCDGCVVCDLLAQYHAATPFSLDPLSIELVGGEATIQLQNAVVSAATRLALSRGPPTV